MDLEANHGRRFCLEEFPSEILMFFKAGYASSFCADYCLNICSYRLTIYVLSTLPSSQLLISIIQRRRFHHFLHTVLT